MNNPANKLVNLNRVRKQKKRVDDEKKAAENRVKFGRTRAEKNNDKKAQENLARHVDGHQGEVD